MLDRAKRACPRASISHEQVYPTSSITTAPRCLERSEMAKTRLYILDKAYVKTRKIALMTNRIRGPKGEIRVLCGALAGCVATRPCGAECSIERSEPVHEQVYPTSSISREPLDASSVARWPKLVYIYWTKLT